MVECLGVFFASESSGYELVVNKYYDGMVWRSYGEVKFPKIIIFLLYSDQNFLPQPIFTLCMSDIEQA